MQVVFKESANASISKKFVSLFPGLGYAAGYKVLQRVYKCVQFFFPGSAYPKVRFSFESLSMDRRTARSHMRFKFDPGDRIDWRARNWGAYDETNPLIRSSIAIDSEANPTSTISSPTITNRRLPTLLERRMEKLWWPQQLDRKYSLPASI
jgi:hypothetical protein